MRRVEFSARADRSIARLGERDRTRVADAALELAGNPLAGKRLKGRFEKEGLRSYRVWPLRIIYRFDVQLLSVVEVGHRRDIYH